MLTLGDDEIVAVENFSFVFIIHAQVARPDDDIVWLTKADSLDL